MTTNRDHFDYLTGPIRLDENEIDWQASYAEQQARASYARQERDKYRAELANANAAIATLHEEAETTARDMAQLRRRAIKAERERDDARADLDEMTALVASLRAEQPRPLGPEDIDLAMVRRALDAYFDRRAGENLGEWMGRVLTAALTPEPQRPEGAEELDPHVDASLRGVGLNPLSAEDLRVVADNLASEGVRVQGAES